MGKGQLPQTRLIKRKCFLVSSYTALWVHPVLKYVFISCPFIQLFQTGAHVNLGNIVVSECLCKCCLESRAWGQRSAASMPATFTESCVYTGRASLLSPPTPPHSEYHRSPLLPHPLLWSLSAVYDTKLPMIQQQKTWVPGVVSSLSIVSLLFWMAILTLKSTPTNGTNSFKL